MYCHRGEALGYKMLCFRLFYFPKLSINTKKKKMHRMTENTFGLSYANNPVTATTKTVKEIYALC